MRTTVIPSQLVACPTCARQPTECCVDDDGREIGYTHAKRIEAARLISAELERGQNVLITDDSILETGLV